MHPAGFEHGIPTRERPQTYDLDRAAAAIGEIKRRGRNCRVVLRMGLTNEYGVFLAESLACL
jgi:hypothetical protein